MCGGGNKIRKEHAASSRLCRKERRKTQFDLRSPNLCGADDEEVVLFLFFCRPFLFRCSRSECLPFDKPTTNVAPEMWPCGVRGRRRSRREWQRARLTRCSPSRDDKAFAKPLLCGSFGKGTRTWKRCASTNNARGLFFSGRLFGEQGGGWMRHLVWKGHSAGGGGSSEVRE